MQRAWRRKWSKNKEFRQTMLRKAAGSLVAATILCGTMAVYANPVRGTISSGQGTIVESGSVMTITQQTDKMGINWGSFNIGAGEQVNFVQPSNQSIALNRVLTSNPSMIYGTLTANGKVFLINPSGILFAPGANVNVGGLVATTSNIPDADFIDGSYKLQGGQGGSVINRGNITAFGGNVELLGSVVSNQGIIDAARFSVDDSSGVVRLVGNSVSLDLGSLVFADTKVVLRAGVGNNSSSSLGTVRIDASDAVIAPKADIYYNPVAYNDSQTNSTLYSNPYKNILRNVFDVNAYMLVNKADDLQKINTNLNGVYALNANLDLGGTSFKAIGYGVGDFTGMFDGQDYTLSNMSISSAGNIGLFSTLNQAVIRNLSLSNVDVKSTATGANTSAGALAGLAKNSNISDIRVNGAISGKALNIGGVVGYSTGHSTISNIYTTADVTAANGGINAQRNVGGIVGSNDDGSIVENSTNFGRINSTITTTSERVNSGGIAGLNNNSSVIKDSTNYGQVNFSSNTTNSYTGGIVGANWGDSAATASTIINSTNRGDVTISLIRNPDDAGGIAGNQRYSAIVSSTNAGNISGASPWMGGLVGSSYYSSITDSVNSGNVTSSLSGAVGGLVGYQEYSTITDSRNTGIIKDTTNTAGSIGGIVGKSIGGSLDEVTNSGSVVSNNNSSNTGGLLGWGSNVEITNSKNTGDVGGRKSSHVGGVVGAMEYGLLGCVENSGSIYALDTVSGLSNSNVGGIIGWNNGGTIFNGLNSGRIYGEYATRIGGIAGYNTVLATRTGTDVASIIDSSNTGSMIGYLSGAYIGGIVGVNQLSKVVDSTNTGNVEHRGNTAYAGGIAALNEGGSISQAVNMGSVTSYGAINTVGGIAAFNSKNAVIADSSNSGRITINKTGTASSMGYLGGIVGNNSASTVADSRNNGTIEANGNYFAVGGIAGTNLSNGRLEQVNNTGSVITGANSAIRGNISLGGIVGRNDNGIVLAGTNAGTVMGQLETSDVGGIAGYNNSAGQILKSANSGSVINAGNNGNTGGVAGYNYGSIAQSYNDGMVASYGSATQTGGIAGGNNSSIVNSYNLGTISGGIATGSVGGLVGYNYNYGRISSSYNSSTVNQHGLTYAGAVAGYSTVANFLTNTYYNHTMAGFLGAVSNYGTVITGVKPLLGTQMNDAASFAGWNFATVWQIDAVTGMPSLQF